MFFYLHFVISAYKFSSWAGELINYENSQKIGEKRKFWALKVMYLSAMLIKHGHADFQAILHSVW